MLSCFNHEECYPSFHCHYAHYLLLQNVHILNINCVFECIGEMSHCCVPVLYADPYAKKWVKLLTVYPCSTLKKNLFVYTHRSKYMLQTMSIRPSILSWSNNVIKGRHDGNYLATFQISFLSTMQPICWYHFKSIIQFCLSL